MREILTGDGHEIVAEAATRDRAVRKAGLPHPDIVMLDIAPEDVDVALATRETVSAFPKARVIVTTSTSEDHLWMAAAMEAGAASCVGKPYNCATILAAVHKALARPLAPPEFSAR